MAVTTASGAAWTTRYPSTTWRRVVAFASSCRARRSMLSHLKARNSRMISISVSTFGSRPTSPTRLTLTRICSLVRRYSCSSTKWGSPVRRSSTTTRMPVRSDSSRTSATPSICRPFTRSAICTHRLALFVWYGIEVMMMASRTVFPLPPPLIFSMVAPPRSVTDPLPVSYISRNPSRGRSSIPPVGKSGAGITRSKSSSVHPSGSAANTHSASTTSRRLCGGIDVAIPTAIPVLPLMRMLGRRAGSTEGSVWLPSKVSVKSTASAAISARSMASATDRRRHSV
mmetsp:Transcript_11410/g.18351  ORF Transcript_11410/g.18351 Transcript_11410/m.18351 type:complete len:284 (-) Transcript_11410:635-1486(-)